MANIEYVKNYKEKELRQYVLAFLLIAIASVGFQSINGLQLQVPSSATNVMISVFQMIMTDIFVGATCVLVMIFNEIWPDRAKTKIVYGHMPSDTVFTRISNGKIDTAGFDLEKARGVYAHLFSASAAKQTSEWNILLRKCRDADYGNVVEAERMQQMTRDLCISTVSLLIMNLIIAVILAIANESICFSFRMLGLPVVYLMVMLIVTRFAARNRANRFLSLVIKNSVQDDNHN